MNSSRKPQIFWDGGNFVARVEYPEGEQPKISVSPDNAENRALLEKYRDEIMRQCRGAIQS